MKKLITLTLLLTSFFTSNAQTCKCNPNGFNPFVYSYLGDNQTVRAGHQFSVKCNTPVKLDGGYKCSYTTPCDVKLKAVLKNGAGVVIRTYAEFSFPFQHEFEAGGSYVLEIVPWCNGKKCTSAKFYFTVSCDAPVACKCNDKNGWDVITAYIDKVPKKIACGATIELKKDQPFALKGGYKCDGNCDVVLNATLTNSTTGASQNFPNFKMDGVNSPFPTAGKYKLVITPVCGGVACKICILYINVN